MRSLALKVLGVSLLAGLVVGLAACSGPGGNEGGRLSLSLTDKPTNAFTAVFVTIKEIDVHAANDAEDAWQKALDVNQTFNLMELGNGVRKQLGIVNLAPGHYTQMRLIIGTEVMGDHPFANYVIDANGVPHEMKIPSGIQTGIKLVQGFDINENSTTELTFDFDASRSVVVAGRSGKFLLKPTIHMIGDTEVRTVIKGTVMDADGKGVAGANISVQVYNAAAADPKDQVTELFSTLTDSTGAYLFFFLDVPDPTTFNLVATDWAAADIDFAPAFQQIVDAVNGNVYPVDFTLLAAAEVGTVDITVSGAATDETPVTLSFRQTSDLAGAPVVEVRSINFTNGGPFHIDLPVGDYTIVATTAGKPTLVLPTVPPLTVTKAGPNTLTVAF